MHRGCKSLVLTIGACLLSMPIAQSQYAADFEPITVAQNDALGGPNDKSKLVHRREDLLETDESLKTALGLRLFEDPQLGKSASCASCHVPPSEGPTTTRNTPALLDVAQGDRFNHDGAFGSLGDLIKAKLASPDMGWSTDEAKAASITIRDALLRRDQPKWTYVQAFSSVYSVDLTTATQQETVEAVARALADYVRGLNATRTAPYDAFGYVNRIQEAAAGPEDAKAFGGRVLGRLGNIEGRVAVKFLTGFNELEYQGLKIFFATEGNEKVGNCVTCHYPPHFTDYSFHNTGVSQEAYDTLHGEGSFAGLDVPTASEAVRPSRELRAHPDAEDPAKADLGHWNYADIEESPLRAPGENADVFLERMIGAFKTPGLRNLSHTGPYMHNGAYTTLEDALAQKIRASDLAKVGKLRGADAELELMNITEKDIPALAAFLRALNEVPPENYRDLIVKGITIRPYNPTHSEDTDSSSWVASPESVKSFTKRLAPFNYDESKVPDYVLPDPLVGADGEPITDAEAWRTERRPEILELFKTQVYGRAPGRPDTMVSRVIEYEPDALNGKAVRKQVAIFFDGTERGSSMEMLLYLPRGANSATPVFLAMNFKGNQSIHHDKEIQLASGWAEDPESGAVVYMHASEESRGESAKRWPVEKILERGYALATIYYGDIDPDFDDGFLNGVHGYYDTHVGDERPADAWGSIAAWAWGLSRAMDYFETDQDIDEKRVAVLGHSRLGKTALWAGARDEQFALVISNDSGCGGAALSRRVYGETIKRINTTFPHWFCGNFKQYNGNEAKLPVDQHMLIALMAPRPVYIASADQDLWADPRGEFLAAQAAGPVYRLLGKKGLEVDAMPPLDSPIHNTIGHHIRTGGHNINEYDWQNYLDFVDKQLKK